MGEPGRSQQDTGVEAKQALGDTAHAVGMDLAAKRGLRHSPHALPSDSALTVSVSVAAKLSLRHNARALSFDTVLRPCLSIKCSGSALK